MERKRKILGFYVEINVISRLRTLPNVPCTPGFEYLHFTLIKIVFVIQTRYVFYDIVLVYRTSKGIVIYKLPISNCRLIIFIVDLLL